MKNEENLNDGIITIKKFHKEATKFFANWTLKNPHKEDKDLERNLDIIDQQVNLNFAEVNGQMPELPQDSESEEEEEDEEMQSSQTLAIRAQIIGQTKVPVCYICHKPFVDKVITNCMHYYCRGCIDHWRFVHHNISCPYCQQIITEVKMPVEPNTRTIEELMEDDEAEEEFLRQQQQREERQRLAEEAAAEIARNAAARLAALVEAEREANRNEPPDLWTFEDDLQVQPPPGGPAQEEDARADDLFENPGEIQNNLLLLTFPCIFK